MKLRLILSPVRSGSTALLHTLSHHPDVETATFLMKRNIFYGRGNDVDYSIYNVPVQKRCLVYKATFGYKSAAECTYSPFRYARDMLDTRPIFLFRNPVATYGSWRRQNWGSIELFLKAYFHVLALMRECRIQSRDTTSLTLEWLAENPEPGFRRILAHWGLHELKNISAWDRPFGEGTVSFTGDQDGEMSRRLYADIERGVYESLLHGSQTFHSVNGRAAVGKREKSLIERQLMDDYLQIHYQCLEVS